MRADAQALWFEGAATTYGELDALSSRCAQALIAAGAKPGDRIGTLSKGNDDFFVLWFGCLKARVCLTPVNWRLAPPEVEFILKDAGCRLVVAGSDYTDLLAGLDLPDLTTTIVFGDEFRAWLSTQPATDPHPRRGPKTTSSSSTPRAPPACPRASSSPRPTTPTASMGPPRSGPGSSPATGSWWPCRCSMWPAPIWACWPCCRARAR
uniref:AMP-binding protein n=1 Tax=Phenylobacterium glaciei TaxID=2803784 RepID=A0A974S8M8_9CAUL|nr:AMP-binding protein [Phenylobacterium glaciei]